MSRNESEFPTDDELKKLAGKMRGAARSAHIKILKSYDPDTYGNYLDQLDGIDSTVEWLGGAFDDFLKPSPWDFDEKLVALDEIASTLGHAVNETEIKNGLIQGRIDTTKQFLGEGGWKGALADSFKMDYLEPIGSHIAANQGAVTLVTHDGLQAMRDIYGKARENLKDLGEKAVTAFEAADGISANDLKTMLTVISSVFGLGTAVLSVFAPAAAAGAGVASALVAGGIAIGSDKIGEEEESELSADYPDEVEEKLKDALEKLRGQITTMEDELIKVLDEGKADIASLVWGEEVESLNPATAVFGMGKQSLLAPAVPDLSMVAFGDDPSELKDGLVQVT